LVDDPQTIIQANVLCNQAGMDTISAGTLVGMLLHAATQGLISWKTLELPESAANDDESKQQAIIDLLGKISQRKGIGDLLADGALHAGKTLGISHLVPHVKGLEFPAYDPRVSPGMALAYMTSDRGACHLRTYPFGRETSGVLPWFSCDGKAEFVKRQQDEKAGQECLGVCQFPYGIGILTDHLPRLLSAFSGQEWTYARICEVGERTWNLSRAFNVALGASRETDQLPERFTTTPMPDGMGKGHLVSSQDRDCLLDRYYQLRGWDERGRPTPATWKRLNLPTLVGNLPERYSYGFYSS
jgi:aldehyde:ferredoxin oxidoreductase